MNTVAATQLFESLSSAVRLEVFRLLVKRGGTGMVAGELAAAQAIPPANLSFHLKALTHAGLVSVKQEGRFQRYAANIPLMLELIAYLTEECCAGQPEKCEELRRSSNCEPAFLLNVNTPLLGAKK